MTITYVGPRLYVFSVLRHQRKACVRRASCAETEITDVFRVEGFIDVDLGVLGEPVGTTRLWAHE